MLKIFIVIPENNNQIHRNSVIIQEYRYRTMLFKMLIDLKIHLFVTLKKLMMKFLLILFFFIPSLLTYAQTTDGYKDISKEINELADKNVSSYEESFNNGKKMLSLAKTKAEFARAYGHMGFARFNQLKYSEAIPLFEKGRKYANESNYYYATFLIDLNLKKAYEIIGLKSKALECWEEAQQVGKKLDTVNANFMINQEFAYDLEEQDKYSEAIPFRLKMLDIVTNSHISTPQAKIMNIAMMNYILAYNYLKSKKINDAIRCIQVSEKYLKEIPDISKMQDIEEFYLCKGMIYAEQNNISQAKKWFDLAGNSVNKRNNKDLYGKILEERLLYGIDDPKKNKIIINDYIEQKKKFSKDISTIVTRESEIENHNRQKQKFRLKLLIVVIIILSIIILFLNHKYKKGEKKLQTKFEKIISNLEQNNTPKEIKANFKDSDNYRVVTEEKLSLNSIMSKEKEAELLSKMIEFEKGIEFTNKNFTISNFIAILETNSKYANYILKKHRKKNFNDYVNGLKIKFIIEKLYTNPEYLNYKINYLSELSGFSTHSRFAQIFKNETGISPSEFISKLSKTKRDKK
jgi:tetratricopeptide (TPR) repeat protein/AraC-like DNA-binding protein